MKEKKLVHKKSFKFKQLLIVFGVLLGLWLAVFTIDFFKVALTQTSPIFSVKEESCTLTPLYDAYGNCTNCVGSVGCHFKGLGYNIFLHRFSKMGGYVVEIKIFNKMIYNAHLGG